MKVANILAAVTVAFLSFINASAQSIHSTTVCTNNDLISVSPAGSYKVKHGDAIEVTTYKPTKTQVAKYPAGKSYDMLMLSQGKQRNPQAFLIYNLGNKAHWKNAFATSKSFKVNGLGVDGNELKGGDTFSITAIQYKENGPIELNIVFSRKGKKVGTIFAETKAMKWPGN